MKAILPHKKMHWPIQLNLALLMVARLVVTLALVWPAPIRSTTTWSEHLCCIYA